MKINNLVEQIFAIAVALDQNGTLRNTIYAIGKEIFIMNYDHSVLMRFELRKSEAPFDTPISFKANDYDSNHFEEVDGKIIFRSSKGEYEREKSVGTTDMTPAEIKALFESYPLEGKSKATSRLSSDVTELLEDSLSHIEFSGKKGKALKLTQRNIYSGGKVEVTKSGKGFFTDDLKKSVGPLALKTSDFNAMFAFQTSLDFTFPDLKKEEFLIIKSVGGKRNMTAIIAACIYDEIIKIKEAKKDGKENKKSKGGRNA